MPILLSASVIYCLIYYFLKCVFHFLLMSNLYSIFYSLKLLVDIGCMVDNDQRVLKNLFKYDFASPELCAEKCNSLSMKYMGLEAR